MKIVSLLMLTIDRYDTTIKTLAANIESARANLPSDISLELLVADNGSTDRRVVTELRDHVLCSYHRDNQSNEGCGKAFNQLYLRSRGQWIVLLGNDIAMPTGWLAESLRYLEKVPKAGLVGIDWGHGGVPPLATKFEINAHWLTPQLDRVFGTTILKRELVEDLGLFSEEFGPYGLEDSDLNNRVNLAGYHSFYLPSPVWKSVHLEHDVGQVSGYRKMKDESLAKNLEIYARRVSEYPTKGFREPLPEKRGPMCSTSSR